MDLCFFFVVIAAVDCAVTFRTESRVTVSPVFGPLADTDGQSLWSSIQNESPPREPDYSSIEELFCLPVAENKDKKTAAPVKKVSKEVCEVNASVSTNDSRL